MANVTLRTTLEGDAQVVRGLDAIDKKITGLGGAVRTTGLRLQSMGSALTSVGRGLTLGLTVPLGLAGGALIKFATDTVESESLFEVAMGEMAEAAREFSEELGDTIGANTFEVRRQTATFFQMTTAMGVSRQAAFELSTGLTRLTLDMASFFNLNPDEAFLKLQSGISGEIEPLRRLGISISEVTVKQSLLNRGLIDGSGTLTEQQKILGRYIAIVDQTSNAQGDMARTLESPANQMRILGEQVRQSAIELGSQLLPALQTLLGLGNDLISFLGNMIERFNNMSAAGKGVVIVVTGLVVGIGPLLSIVGLLTRAFGGLLIILGAINAPILIAVSAVAAAVAAFLLLKDNIDLLVDALKALDKFLTGGLVGEGLELLKDGVGAAVDFVSARVRNLLGDLASIGGGVREQIEGALDAAEVGKGADEVFEKFSALFEGIRGSAEENLDAVKGAFAEIGALLEGAQFEASEEAAEAIRKRFQDALGVIEEEFRKQSESATASSAKAIKKQRDLAIEQFEFEVELGNRSLEEFRQFLEAKLAEVEAGTAEELALRRKVHEIDEELREESLTNLKLDFLDVRDVIQNVARDAQGAFRGFFSGVIREGKSFSDSFKDFFTDMLDSILEQIANFLADQVFQKFVSFLFGADTGNANAGGGIFGFLGGGGGGGLGAGGGGGAGSFLATAGTAIGSVFGPVGGAVGGFLGSALGGLFQTGGDFTVTSPRFIGVGERGSERVSIRPTSGGHGPEGLTVVVQGDLVTDDLGVARLARRVAEDLRRSRTV